jgi:hypothetical protein
MDTERRKRVRLAVLVSCFPFFVLMLLSLIGFLLYNRAVFLNNFRSIRVGDTKARVVGLLGEPQQKFPKGGQITGVIRQQGIFFWLLIPEPPETWVYGRWKLLRLAPEVGDCCVEFDDAGRVLRVYSNERAKE